MTSSLARQIAEIEQELAQNVGRGAWCPECGYGLQVLILMDGEPEPICGACNQPKARGEDVRLIRITERRDGPQ